MQHWFVLSPRSEFLVSAMGIATANCNDRRDFVRWDGEHSERAEGEAPLKTFFKARSIISKSFVEACCRILPLACTLRLVVHWGHTPAENGLSWEGRWEVLAQDRQEGEGVRRWGEGFRPAERRVYMRGLACGVEIQISCTLGSLWKPRNSKSQGPKAHQLVTRIYPLRYAIFRTEDGPTLNTRSSLKMGIFSFFCVSKILDRTG